MNIYYWDLTARQLTNTATAAEQLALQQWRAADPAHEAQYQQQKQLWDNTAPPGAQAVDTDAAWQRVSAMIQPAAEVTEPARAAKVMPLYAYLLRVAALVAVLLGLGLFAYIFSSKATMQIAKAEDKQVKVVLPDSSQVWLNQGSTLTYAAAFNGANRVVQLEGEAFFQVRHNTRRPFIVKTGPATTRVLGTSFNLRAYPTAPAVELTVATGKVAFTSERGTEVTVTPGYGAALDKQNSRVTKFPVADTNAWAWQSGQLRFVGQPLREVLPVLEHYYGITLQLSDSALTDCRFTGTFDRAPLSEVLQVLEATLQLHPTKQSERAYLLKGPGCQVR